jgi:hypothetical protein
MRCAGKDESADGCRLLAAILALASFAGGSPRATEGDRAIDSQAGTGSVFVPGGNDLEPRAGAEFRIRARTRP